MKILVTGATGHVGTHVVRELAASHDVIATGRTVIPHTSNRLTWQQADLADATPWPRLLEDVDAAFLFPAFGHTQSFIDAATETGLPKLVLLSSGAVSDVEDSMIKAVHAEIEDQALASRVPCVRVRPTAFMANDLAWLPAIRKGESVPLPYPHAAMPVVAEQDIAAVIARCLTHDVDGDIYEVTGPRSLSQVERLQILARHITDTDANWTDITDEAEQNGLPSMPGPPGEYLLRNLQRAANVPVPPTREVPGLLGRSAMDYAAWTKATTR